MNEGIAILIFGALGVYSLVLWVHSLRHKFGPVHFYALMGCLTAIMSWVTDAGMTVNAFGMTFYIGSTVFYTALLLGVFSIYVFDGPGVTQVLISTIVGLSALVPLVAMFLHFQHALVSDVPLQNIPMPSLRINSASVLTTLVDLIFLAVVWESLGSHHLDLKLGLRTFFTLLGVMGLDVLLFSTLAFAGTPDYLSIMKASLFTRLIVTLLAFPMLYLYIHLEKRRKDVSIEDRPVLSILRRIADMEEELNEAQAEIERRKQAEAALQKALSEVKSLKGMLPICAACKSIRNDEGFWEKIETYIRNQTDAEFSHGICPECQNKYYRDLV